MLGEVAFFVVLRGDRLFHLPVMAQRGDQLPFRLAALGAGQELGARKSAGRFNSGSFRPIMITVGGSIRARARTFNRGRVIVGVVGLRGRMPRSAWRHSAAHAPDPEHGGSPGSGRP